MEVFKLIYDTKKSNQIKLFDVNFIRNNQKNCKMIIDNKLLPLKYNYNVDNIKKDLKVKLVLFTRYGLNLKEMFFKCVSLKEFKI